MGNEDGIFLLDANVFIEAKRRYYGFDLCPGFWESLVFHHDQERVYSIDRVKDELQDGGDDLANWASAVMPADHFISTDSSSVIACYGEIISWVYDQEQFRQGAKDDFSSRADGWLVACAKAEHMVLVTHEVHDPHVRKKVPIPNICRHFGVAYTDTFEMLRTLAVKFDWVPDE